MLMPYVKPYLVDTWDEKRITLRCIAQFEMGVWALEYFSRALSFSKP
jgi:hypothetical protein